MSPPSSNSFGGRRASAFFISSRSGLDGPDCLGYGHPTKAADTRGHRQSKRTCRPSSPPCRPTPHLARVYPQNDHPGIPSRRQLNGNFITVFFSSVFLRCFRSRTILRNHQLTTWLNLRRPTSIWPFQRTTPPNWMEFTNGISQFHYAIPPESRLSKSRILPRH